MERWRRFLLGSGMSSSEDWVGVVLARQSDLVRLESDVQVVDSGDWTSLVGFDFW